MPGALREFFFPERGVINPLAYALLALAGYASGLGLGVWNLGQRTEWALYDLMLRTATQGSPPAPGIVIVAIDELSLKEIGLRWPWPRDLHATLIDRLTEAGAATIVLDLLLDVPSTDPSEDAALAAAVRRSGRTVIAVTREEIRDLAYSVVQWIEPYPELRGSARALGVATLELDPDHVVRRITPRTEDRASLALAAAEAQPGFRLLGDPERPHLIRFNGPPRHGIQTVSYYQALDWQNYLPEATFRDKIVFVGLSLAASSPDEEAPDHFATSAHTQMAGVEIHANVADMLLRDREISDPFGSLGIQVVGCFVLAALVALAFYAIGPLAGLTGTIVLALAFIFGAYESLARVGLRLPVIAPAFSVAGVFLTTAAYRMAVGFRERAFIRRAFQHYVSPAIVDRILSGSAELKLGGEEYEVTILFADLAGFTSLSERLSPEEVRGLLSEYFEEMMQVLLAENATLDKFIGDAIMVFFGCPVRDPSHAVRACRAALAMQDRMAEVNRRRTAGGQRPLEMRVGINTGKVVAGNVGTEEVFDYTIIGDPVNLASRLEGVNKEYSTRILISELTYHQARNGIEARELDRLRVKGKEEPITIYELVSLKGAMPPQRELLLKEFASGLAAYREKDWDGAIGAFDRSLDVDPDDGPSRVFQQRCREFREDPPGPDWNGVHVLLTK